MSVLLSESCDNSGMHPQILVLGSGQDGGSPQTGRSSGVGPERTASSLAVVSRLGSVVWLDASPDLRSQSHRLLAWDGYPAHREELLDAIAITHGHMGHYAGLLHLGREAANVTQVPLVATPSFLAFIEANAPWSALIENGNVKPAPLDPTYRIDETMTLRGLPVPHRAEFTDTVGISVATDGMPWLLYLPDIDDWRTWDTAEAVIADHPVSFLDATFSSTDELPGRDMDEIKHPLVTDTIERFAHLTASRRIVLCHINHTNTLADPDSSIARMASAAGFLVAYDGMVIDA